MGKQHFLLGIEAQVFGTALFKERLTLLDAFQLDLFTLLDVVTVVRQTEAIADCFLCQTVVHLCFQLFALLMQGLTFLILFLLTICLCLALLTFLFLYIGIRHVSLLFLRFHDNLRQSLLYGFVCSTLADRCADSGTFGNGIPSGTGRRWSRECFLHSTLHIVELSDSGISDGLEALFEAVFDFSPVQREYTFYHCGHCTQFVNQ